MLRRQSSQSVTSTLASLPIDRIGLILKAELFFFADHNWKLDSNWSPAASSTPERPSPDASMVQFAKTVLNADGSIRTLNGYSSITSTLQNLAAQSKR